MLFPEIWVFLPIFLPSGLEGAASTACHRDPDTNMSPASSDRTHKNTAVPLVVDVDGSLVRGDLLTEGLLRLSADSPAKLFALPYWLASGRAPLKRWLAQQTGALPAATLVLNPAVLAEIDAAKATGREVWLASGSDELVVAPLAREVGATGCFASDGRANLVGHAKAAVLVGQFGEHGFDYIGNERRDLAVWKRARRAIGVNLSSRLAQQVKALDQQARFLPGLGGNASDFFRVLRPRQWLANALVFVPVVATPEAHAGHYVAAAGGFAALSACASSRCIVEDLLNLPDDRKHAGKQKQPMTAGKTPLPSMIGVASALAAGGLALAFWLAPSLGLGVLLYALLGLGYLLWLRQVKPLGIFTRALFNVFPLFVGAAVMRVPLSLSLLAFWGD